MQNGTPSLFALTPTAFWRWGQVVLGGGLALSLLLVLYFAWAGSILLYLIPAAVLGGMGVVFLFRHPLLNLSVLLAGFVLVTSYEEGIQISEALYGLYFLGFIAHWFFTRGLLYQTSFLAQPESKALFLFLVLMTLSFPLTMLYGGSLRSVFSEWIALMMLAVYFPVKEVCSRYRHGVQLVLGLIVWIGLFVALRNILEYFTSLSVAKYVFQVARGRVVTNDNLLMIVSLMAFVFLLFAERWKTRLWLLGLFMLFFAALIMTLSRGYWLAFALGAFVMFLLLDAHYQRRTLLVGLSGGIAFLGLGTLFLGDTLILILAGLLERITSLGTATTKDLSLLGRIYETKAAFGVILDTPVVGHGMGVSFSFFDILTHTQVERTFIHNGYLSLWYRFGLWGLGLVLFFWVRTIRQSVKAFRQRHAPLLLRAGGLAVASVLVALTLSTVTSNPFFLNDSLFCFGLLTGLAAGTYERTQCLGATPPLL